jgi:coatomer protein complex subunit gamma
MFDLLEGWLRHKSDMVNYEAARAICQMRGVTPPQLTRTIAQLQLFLSSPKPTLKFAAIRTLSALAITHPSSVAACNVDMENLISDPNRSIATYAITTLLKVSHTPRPKLFLSHLVDHIHIHIHRPGTKPPWTD